MRRRRELTFAYGPAGGADDRISRIASIDDSILSTRMAEFGYAGTMRRVVFNRGWNQALLAGVGAFAVAQGFDAAASSSNEPGYEGLDRFGRVAELRFEGPGTGSGPELQHSYGYVHDLTDSPTQRLSDGRFFYQYDAWGRLIKVSDLGTLVLGTGGAHVSGAPGDWLIHYTYDALGRLARLQRPLAGYPGFVHTEHFSYDGARRIQEVFNSLAAQGGGDEQSSQGETQTPTLETWTDREYIHTAGPGAYVDELVCEVAGLAGAQVPLFHLQDANYTVVGLVNAAGAVVRQHTFDAYRQLLYAEDLQAAATSRLGHQGLFFDRLDAPQGSRDLTPRHTPTATPGIYTLAQIDGLSQNRNRTYSPGLQRFVQRDPNGTGVDVARMLVASGAAAPTMAPHPVVEDIGANGWSLHTYLGNGPTNKEDPSGLFFTLPTLAVNGLAEGLEGGWSAHTEMAGHRAGGLLGAMLEQYAINQLFDTEWASDWSMGDYWSSSMGSATLGWVGGAPAGSSGTAGEMAIAGLSVNLGAGAGRAAHGGMAHDAWCRAYYAFFEAKCGSGNVRFNQALFPGSTGPVAGRLRPDVQAYDPRTGQYYIVEIADSHSLGSQQRGQRRRAIADLLGVPKSQASLIYHDLNGSNVPSIGRTFTPRIRLPGGSPGRRKR